MDTSDVRSEPPEWRNHLALLASAGTVLFIGLRVLAVSHFDLTTATALVGSQGTFDIGVATLLPLIPVIPLVASMLPVRYAAMSEPWSKKGVVPLATSAILFSAFLLLGTMEDLFESLAVLAVGALIGLLFVGYLSLRGQSSKSATVSAYGRARSRRQGQQFASWTIAIMILIVLGSAALSSDPWTPVERIETSYGQELVGSVMKDSGSDLVVLIHSDRSVVRVQGTKVASRSICSIARKRRSNGVGYKPSWATEVSVISELFFHNSARPNYPDCP